MPGQSNGRHWHVAKQMFLALPPMSNIWSTSSRKLFARVATKYSRCCLRALNGSPNNLLEVKTTDKSKRKKNRSANGRDWDKRNGSRGREPVCSAEQVKVMNGCADWAVFILLCRNAHCERNPLNESQIEFIPANEKSSSSRELPAEIERYILTWLCAPDDFWRRLEQIAGGWLGDCPGRIEYRPTDNEAMQVLFFLFGFMWHVMCNSRKETVRLYPPRGWHTSTHVSPNGFSTACTHSSWCTSPTADTLRTTWAAQLMTHRLWKWWKTNRKTPDQRVI